MWDMPLPLAGPVGVPPPPVVFIAAGSVSNVASFDIAWGDAQFEEVNILLDQWEPAVNGVPQLAISDDDGATFDTGASDYLFQGLNNHTTLATGFSALHDRAQIGADNADGRMLGGTATGCFLWTILRPFDTGRRVAMEGWGGFSHNILSNASFMQGSGWRDAAKSVNAVRLNARNGNVSARYFAWGELPV